VGRGRNCILDIVLVMFFHIVIAAARQTTLEERLAIFGRGSGMSNACCLHLLIFCNRTRVAERPVAAASAKVGRFRCGTSTFIDRAERQTVDKSREKSMPRETRLSSTFSGRLRTEPPFAFETEWQKQRKANPQANKSQRRPGKNGAKSQEKPIKANGSQGFSPTWLLMAGAG
jgi:hypothetical protein